MKRRLYNVYLVTRVGDMEKAQRIAQFNSKGVMFVCLNAIRELYVSMVASGDAVIKYDMD